MIQKLREPEVLILNAKDFIVLGVMQAFSPLIRGDETTLIAQVVVRNEDEVVYSIGYRKPLPGEVKKSE